MEKITDRLWKKAGQYGLPMTAAFELLPVCNLHCKMCYVRKSMEEVQKKGGLMDGEQWLEYAKEAQHLGLLFPLLTGGEPLLHPDFREIFTGISEMGMQVSVNSNATLINQETARWFGKHRPTRINVTLYGANEESYQNLCGDGSAYGRVRNAVQWLKENHVPVKFNTSITPQNVGDLESIIEYAYSVESPIQVATYMFPPYRSKDLIGRNERLNPEEAGYARVKADYLQNDSTWFLGQMRRFRHFVPLEQLDFTKKAEREMKMSCRGGHCSMWIDWQGNIANCGMYGSVELPIKNRTLADAWNEMREKTHQVRYKPVCAECPNQPLCHSCIAMVHNECGDIDGRPEYLCRMNEASARYYREFAERYYPEEMKKIYGGGGSFADLQLEHSGCGLDEL